MRTMKYMTVIAAVMMAPRLAIAAMLSQATTTFGPEIEGLRMGLQITSVFESGRNSYSVCVRLLNTSDRPITLVGPAVYEGGSDGYAEWLKAEVGFTTFPEIMPPGAQTRGNLRTSPWPRITLAPGKPYVVSWTSQGRYLKTRHRYNTTPCFHSDGLYGVRAHFQVHTPDGGQFQLFSNQCPVSVSGTIRMPKYAVGRVIRGADDPNRVTLSLGSRHRIVKGDRFHVMGQFPNGWLMTVTDVSSTVCSVSVDILGDPNKIEPLPPEHAKAQLWDFDPNDVPVEPAPPRSAAAQVQDSDLQDIAAKPSSDRPNPVHIGMTRGQLRKICHIDGGLSTIWQERWVFNAQPADAPKGKVLKVAVTLRPGAMPADVYADPQKHRKWVTTHTRPSTGDDDVIVTVGEPYFEPPYCD